MEQIVGLKRAVTLAAAGGAVLLVGLVVAPDPLVRAAFAVLTGLAGGVIVVASRRSERLAHAAGEASVRAVRAVVAQPERFDLTTGLPNRTAFDDACRERRNRGAAYAVVVCTLDQFAAVNETWGHRVGDELVAAAATRLRGVIPEEVLLARAAGIEFVALVDGENERERAEEYAAAMHAALTQPFVLDVGEVYVPASVGVAAIDDPADPSDPLRDARAASERARRSGGNRVVAWDHGLQTQSIERADMAVALLAAIGTPELELHYQPIVALRDGEWRGMEALVRWNRPGVGYVAPAEFLSVAEEHGCIVDIDTWVLREACRQLSEWRAAGFDWVVSVNLSARQVSDALVVDAIDDAMADAQLVSGALWLDITESAFAEHDSHAIELLHELRAIGVRLSVDDFGTGDASLSYLARYPLDRVKIDRSFVAGLSDREDSAAIVKAIVAMAGALKLATVAEGVETEQQRRRLLELGCTYAQGYLFAKPMPAAEVARHAPAPARDLSTPHA